MALRCTPLASCFHAHKLLSLFLIFLSILLGVVRLSAQSTSSATDERVMKLHDEAKTAEQRGDLNTAIANYESILRIAPQLAAAYNNLGALYFKLREYGKAAEVLKKGLKINPEMPSASALLGMSLFERGEYAEARAPFEKALRSNPKDNDLELFLVNDLTRLGEFEAAAAHLQQLKNREPNNQQVWYLLGNVYTQLAQQAQTRDAQKLEEPS